MLDVVYAAVIILFFALLLAYVRACAALGRETTSDREIA